MIKEEYLIYRLGYIYWCTFISSQIWGLCSAETRSWTHSASSWAISASSWSLLLCSSASSSAGPSLAPSDTWSWQVETRGAPWLYCIGSVCVCVAGHLLTGDLKLDWTLLNLENGVLERQDRRLYIIYIISAYYIINVWVLNTKYSESTRRVYGTSAKPCVCAFAQCLNLKLHHISYDTLI